MPKRSFKKLSMGTRCAIVVGISIIFSIILCVVMGAVANSSEDPAKNLTLYGEICFSSSMWFCGFLGAKTASENKFAAGMLSSASFLLVIVITSIFFGTNDFVKALLLALLGLFLSATGSLIGAHEPKRKRRR